MPKVKIDNSEPTVDETAAPATGAEPVKGKKVEPTISALDDLATVLTALGPGAYHHTAVERKAGELGLRARDLCTPAWIDTKKNGETSRFRFYGKSCYGLADWPQPTADQLKEAVPTRPGGKRTGASRTRTPETLKAKIEQYRTLLRAAETSLAELEAEIALKALATE